MNLFQKIKHLLIYYKITQKPAKQLKSNCIVKRKAKNNYKKTKINDKQIRDCNID